MLGSELQDRIAEVREKIQAAEKKSSRAEGSTILIAASKTKSADAVSKALAAGITHFGENYVQEAIKKMDRVQAHWHLIGALQTNKSKLVVGKFETIQSVDRAELAEALNKRAEEAGVVQNILIQMKLGDEPTKGGVTVDLVQGLIEKIIEMKNLRLEGLMSLPPIEAEAEGSRKYFIQLRELREQLRGFVPSESGSFMHLSMGTTHDYAVAVEEGATMVRVGTAIFGARLGFGPH